MARQARREPGQPRAPSPGSPTPTPAARTRARRRPRPGGPAVVTPLGRVRRHGRQPVHPGPAPPRQSAWNALNLFTGWVDVDLTDQGVAEARRGRRAARWPRAVLPDVLHTSLLRRAIRTAELALDTLRPALDPGAPLVAAQRAALRRPAGQGQEGRRWRPTAKSSSCCGAGPTTPRRRRSTPTTSSPRPTTRATRGLAPELPTRAPSAWPTSSTGCCRTGTTCIVPDLRRRARRCWSPRTGTRCGRLVKHLDGISDDAIAGLNIPTGIPLVYRLDGDLRPDGAGRGVSRSGRRRRRDRGGGEPGSLTRASALLELVVASSRRRVDDAAGHAHGVVGVALVEPRHQGHVDGFVHGARPSPTSRAWSSWRCRSSTPSSRRSIS